MGIVGHQPTGIALHSHLRLGLSPVKALSVTLRRADRTRSPRRRSRGAVCRPRFALIVDVAMRHALVLRVVLEGIAVEA
jgi:hypothetical protein